MPKSLTSEQVEQSPVTPHALMRFCPRLDINCMICQRSFHRACLEENFSVDIVNESWWCPLCIKRSWNKAPPTERQGSLDPIKENDRVSTMADDFANDSTLLRKVQLFDNGSSFSDHELLFLLREMRHANHEDTEQADSSPICKLFSVQLKTRYSA